jgi:predicted dithiol-disulfide oxidoreductase (DUF899 family)
MTKHMTGTRKDWLEARLELARPSAEGRNETGPWFRRHDEYVKG